MCWEKDQHWQYNILISCYVWTCSSLPIKLNYCRELPNLHKVTCSGLSRQATWIELEAPEQRLAGYYNLPADWHIQTGHLPQPSPGVPAAACGWHNQGSPANCHPPKRFQDQVPPVQWQHDIWNLPGPHGHSSKGYSWSHPEFFWWLFIVGSSDAEFTSRFCEVLCLLASESSKESSFWPPWKLSSWDTSSPQTAYTPLLIRSRPW